MPSSIFTRDSANPQCTDLALTAGSTASIDVSGLTPVRYITGAIITSDVDASLTAKWGAAAPAAGGTAGTPVDGYSLHIGPSFPPVVLHCAVLAQSLGLKNTSAVSVNWKVTTYLGSTN